MENSKKRKEREGKSREMYEKMFPELRKQREDKVRTCYPVVNVVYPGVNVVYPDFCQVFRILEKLYRSGNTLLKKPV